MRAAAQPLVLVSSSEGHFKAKLVWHVVGVDDPATSFRSQHAGKSEAIQYVKVMIRDLKYSKEVAY